MEDIHRRVALLEIKDELVKKLKPCPFCGKELADFPGCMVFEQVEPTRTSTSQSRTTKRSTTSRRRSV